MKLSNTLSAVEVEPNQEKLVPVSVFGRCLLGNKLEIPCQSSRMSSNELEVTALHSPTLGEHVICYLDHVGRVEGVVDRFIDGGFSIVLRVSERKKERLASRIEWLLAHKGQSLSNHRRYERITPRDENSEIRLKDGRTYPVKIIDISLSGAGLELGVKPAIGSEVSLAGMLGHVVRHMEEGIAIQFHRDTKIASVVSRFGLV